MNPVKAPWQSKQVLLGVVTSLISIIAVFVPAVGTWFGENGSLVGSLLGVVIIILRVISKGKISISE